MENLPVNIKPTFHELVDSGYKTRPEYPYSEPLVLERDDDSIVLTYSKDLWNLMMEYVFPGVFQEDFDEENPRNNNNQYERLFKELAEDFFDSIFQGRDDISPSGGIPISIATWNRLTQNQKKSCFTSYLKTRTNSEDISINDKYMVNNLSDRSSNMRIWLAFILLKSLERIQRHTINVGRAATRYSQTAHAISSEMASNKYEYKATFSTEDFRNLHVNKENSKALEDMKVHRLVMQKEIDKASTDLIQANSEAETFANFINRLIETDLNMIRTIFTK